MSMPGAIIPSFRKSGSHPSEVSTPAAYPSHGFHIQNTVSHKLIRNHTTSMTQGTNAMHFFPCFSAFQLVSIPSLFDPTSEIQQNWCLTLVHEHENRSSASLHHPARCQIPQTCRKSHFFPCSQPMSLYHQIGSKRVCSSAASIRKHDAYKRFSPPFLTPISHRVPFPLSLSTGSSRNGIDMRFSPCNFILQLVWRHIAICCDPDPSFHSCLNLPRYGSKHLSALQV